MQVCIQYSSESGFTIVALSNPKAPDTPPVNRVQCRSLRGGSPPPWTTLPLDTPFPLALADEFAISPYFGFKVLFAERES